MIKRLLALLAFGCATSASAFIIPIPYSVVEYVNEGTGRYLLASGGAPNLDQGAEGGRWVRTGYVFTQYYLGQNLEAPVCHFYSPVLDEHFYTAYASECATVKQQTSFWTYIGDEFLAPPPGPNGCPTSVTVRRLYDGRGYRRYAADPAVIAKMLQRGWIDEGIGFCAYAAGLAPEKSFDTFASDMPRPKAECEARVGPCVALSQLAPMTTRVSPYLPPAYIVTNPAYPPVQGIIGTSGQDIYTSRPAGAADVNLHSFFMNTGGIRIVGSDRLSEPYAGMALMYQLPGVAGPTADERVFPWRNGRERDLVIKSDLSVYSLTLENASSHAYGMPLIQFADRASGRSFFVTLQAFGNSPGGDFVGADYATGWAIVSTSFRENPLFGHRISGNYTQCSSGVFNCLPRTTFAFELSKQDFQAVLGHARTVDPTLSANPADYFVASFRQHNETYRDATIGMMANRLTLEIWSTVQ